jgi:hypothetical protein
MCTEPTSEEAQLTRQRTQLRGCLFASFLLLLGLFVVRGILKEVGVDDGGLIFGLSAFIILIPIPVLMLALRGVRCPRCGKPFYVKSSAIWDPMTKHCVHCNYPAQPFRQ